MSSKNNEVKTKKVVAILLIAIMLLIIAIGIMVGLLIYRNIQKDKNKLPSEVNTSKIENNLQNEAEENILNVELEGEDPLNQIEEPEENNTNPETENKPQVVEVPYYIKVNYEANTVTVYKKEKNGKYNTPIKAFICSVGTSTPTSGVYSISDKYTWRLLVRKCIWAICMQNYRTNIIPFCTISAKG